jgi:hypothetical protein
MLRDHLTEPSTAALWARFIAPGEASTSMVVTIDNPSMGDTAPVRHAISALVSGSQHSDRTDTVLAAHELLANAITHATGPVDLAIAVTTQFTLVAVHDTNPDVPLSTEESYHGLWLLARLSRGHLHIIPVTDAGKWIAVVIHGTRSVGTVPIAS